MLAGAGKESTENQAYDPGMNFAKGIAALVVGTLAAALFGLAAGIAIGALVLVAPLAWVYDAIRRRLPRRAPRPY